MSYSHAEVTLAFAQRKPFNSKGNAKRGHNVFIGNDGTTIYSYGYHFPMAIADDEHKLFIVNGDTYSSSTSGHQSHLRGAISNNQEYKSINIPFSCLASAGLYSSGNRWGPYSTSMPHIEILDVGKEITIMRCETCESSWDDYSEGYWQHFNTNPDHKRYYRHLLAPSLFRSEGRYFLSGFDETARGWNGGYFLSELPHKVKTIEEAFESLAPPIVKFAKTQGMNVKRQGDIFAIETTLTTRKLHKKGTVLPRYVQKPLIGWNDEVLGYEPTDIPLDYAESASIRNGRRPRLLNTNHFATEAIEVVERGKPVVYARGVLYHRPSWREADHRNVTLGKKWHKIFRNTAINSWGVSGRVD